MSKNLKSKNKKKTLTGRPTHFNAKLEKGHPMHRGMESKTAAGCGIQEAYVGPSRDCVYAVLSQECSSENGNGVNT